MATANIAIDRDWIASEFSKGIDNEQSLLDEARSRSESPPDPTLGVLYHQIATADERHRGIVETIATRYGHTPSRSVAGGIGETLGRLKDKVNELSTTPLQRLGHDLASRASAIHWYTAWIEAFQRLGDAESAGALAAILTEEKAHRDALQEGLNRMVTQGATGEATK
ncbi:MAG: hypothetical protein P4L84_11475 [Isosphaeraceae bacterium]|nr:hypothetical protein [Isosphaeraceae bacterium]